MNRRHYGIGWATKRRRTTESTLRLTRAERQVIIRICANPTPFLEALRSIAAALEARWPRRAS